MKVTQLAELCDLASVCKLSMKPRRMKVGDTAELSLQKHEHVVCKFLECMKIDLVFHTEN